MRRDPHRPCRVGGGCSGATGIDPVPDGRSGAGLYAIEQATAASKAALWDIARAPIDGPKVIAFGGELAMAEGHAQDLKTKARALQRTAVAAQQDTKRIRLHALRGWTERRAR
jgi:hypothetical protein